MCGIFGFLCIRENSDVRKINSGLQQDLFGRLKRRGPNHFKETSLTFQNTLDLCFASAVLHLRGTNPSLQPFKDENGNILLWNGEIFAGSLNNRSESDTKILGDKLFNCVKDSDILQVISSIEGPFAFIFYQASGQLWFGRDIFGRRSLLRCSDSSSFKLSSVACTQEEWQEVTTDGIFCLDLKQICADNFFVVYLYPWLSTPSGLVSQLKQIPLLDFSGKIDVNKKLTVVSPISVILNRSLPLEELCTNFTNSSVGNDKSDCDTLSKLLEVSDVCETVSKFEEVLSEAVKRRVQNHQYLCKPCFAGQDGGLHKLDCEHSSVGVLFSGGLDSIVLACLANRHLSNTKSIDLINVAFASTITLKRADKKTPVFETPDRITGQNGALALQKVCPDRQWNFVEVNITEEELKCKRKDVISHLLKPSCTVLDDSIGCALWFAARGVGIISSNEGHDNYTSPARVLLVGMGADEQLGGYSRHRAKFNSFGWSGLVEELSMELDRIGSRNLGRDDRIIADNGVESRYPFLDENVVSFLNSVPVWLKMNLNYPRGIGEKILLRLLALKLGLTEAAVLPKRAIQFGSRIAKIENSKEKGSDICKRLNNL